MDIIELVKTLGFPIAVACWLLLRTDKRLEHMHEMLHEIAKKIGDKEKK